MDTKNSHAGVSCKSLTKSFNKGHVRAVDSVSFDVKKGELFGLIGPDGAGKTTIFRMLTTLLLPDRGSAEVDGLDIVKDYKTIRSRVGYMPGKFSLYQDLTVEENLDFFATLFHTTIAANYDLIKDIYTQIEPFKTRRAGKLSGGMKQKLALCCALIHKPTVLFLDEPTTGVDVISRKEFWEMLKKLRQQGITILVSTPYMDEATLCDRIALIQNGKIMSIDSPANIIKTFPEELYAVKAADMYRLLKDIRAHEGVKSCFAFGEYLHVTFKEQNSNSEQDPADFLSSKNHQELKVEKIDPTIEDCFIRLIS